MRCAQFTRQGHALGQGDVLDGHDGHDVGGADARVRTLMLVKVDQFGGFLGGAEESLQHCGWLPRHGEHAAVVVGVGAGVEEQHARRLDRGDERVDDFGPAALGKVGNGFDDLRHGVTPV
jgi:hypothetical protein